MGEREREKRERPVEMSQAIIATEEQYINRDVKGGQPCMYRRKSR
jgi:hypothetical protein